MPTLPPSWSAGHTRGLRCRGGHVADVTLSTSAVVRDEAGEAVATIPVRPAASCHVRLAWDTAAGGRYIVTPGQV